MQRPGSRSTIAAGHAELAAARTGLGSLYLAVGVFSAVVNILGLTGSVFMLQVYDRVLGSRSVETLAALFALVVLLFAMMGVLDLARSRLLGRIAARYQTRLEARVFGAVLARSTTAPGDPVAASALRDLDAVQRYIASPVMVALFDLPWAPVYLLMVFVFHPWLGMTALAGVLVLLSVTWANQVTTRGPVLAGAVAAMQADRLADQLRDEAEAVLGLGMRAQSLQRWLRLRREAARQTLRASDLSALYSVSTRTFRQFLQSALLAMGAWLVLRGALTGGAMVAASIMMGRALAPVEQAIGGWPLMQRGAEGRRRLAALLAAEPAPAPRTTLPHPRAALDVAQLTIVPPGQTLAALRMVSFRLDPGQALGIIGSSGAGKSTLAQALTGVWHPAGGQIRLDGALLEHYDPDALGRYIGYLPQRVTLFEGTIAENIARMGDGFEAAAVVAAARSAGAHQMILDLPEGYDTRIGPAGGRLSGGQMQRIGLARALFGDPAVLVLDEPNASLDNDGSLALNAAIRGVKARGGAVLIMAHRPAAIQECDMLMVLDGGTRRAFGPRDEVLRSMVRNAADLTRAGAVAGGVA